ncbi:hypothetical protein Glove_357g46 [Diversispora epigaea]|uniref:Uncharacterized protein n=1 Tax=Diversispora epigaea TaxID=1348612 RepID=A0A397HB34_9GLOM|nr:hypothetical protein Glove_357g46 [Diversispora epigaea]
MDTQTNINKTLTSEYLKWEAKLTVSLLKTRIRILNKINNSSIHSNKTRFYQYVIEHEINPKEFSIITEVKKNRWTMRYFRENLEKDICFYRGGIERKKIS